MGCKQSQLNEKPISTKPEKPIEPPLPLIKLIKTKRMLYEEKIRQIYREEYNKQNAHIPFKYFIDNNFRLQSLYCRRSIYTLGYTQGMWLIFYRKELCLPNQD